jgi:hypothetical protein
MLSSPDRNKLIAIMLFYSLLTFYIGPYLFYTYITPDDKDKIINGMIFGFIISILLWYFYGSKMIKI